jgi:hypothetical protein
MRSDFVIYVDFDSTLYNTRVFTQKLWKLLSAHTGLSADKIQAHGASYRSNPALGGYNFDKHIAQYDLNPAVMWDELSKLADNTGYLFEDSAGFIQSLRAEGYDPKILSFGEKRYQLTKITPMLSRLAGDRTLPELEVIVVDKRKREHIAKLHKGQRGVLVDDIPDQELPAGFSEIHIDRQLKLAELQQNSDGYTVANLTQAKQAIDLLSA